MNEIDLEIKEFEKKLADAKSRKAKQERGDEAEFLKDYFTAFGEIIADMHLNGFEPSSYSGEHIYNDVFKDMPKPPPESKMSIYSSELLIFISKMYGMRDALSFDPDDEDNSSWSW